MKTLILISLLIGFSAQAETKPNWFCTDEAGQRNDNVIDSCGVGEGYTETEARASALKEAMSEFSTICLASNDCDPNRVIVEPKRMSCFEIPHDKNVLVQLGGLWKCYRLIQFTALERH